MGGLLQTRFTSGLLSQVSDSPHHPSLIAPPLTIGPLLQWPKLTVQPPSSSRAPELPIKTVGMRRLGGPIPMKGSIAQGKVGVYILCELHLDAS